MNLFDNLQRTVFNIVNNTFGDNAIWVKSNTGVEVSGSILFKDATETARILDQPYSPKNCIMEYQYGDFPGLNELVTKGSEEIVTINDLEYGILKITSKWDGKTFIAELQVL